MVLDDGSTPLSRNHTKQVDGNGPMLPGLDEVIHTHKRTLSKDARELKEQLKGQEAAEGRGPSPPRQRSSSLPTTSSMLPDSPVRTPSPEMSQPRSLRRRASMLAIMAQNDEKTPFAMKKLTKKATFESLDYDEAENNLVRLACSMNAAERRTQRRREAALVWFIVVLCGILTGSAAYLTTYLIGTLSHYKFELVTKALGRGAPWEGWLYMSAFVVGLALAAALLTRWSPETAGSGIPHVKAFLNGNKLDGALRPRALVAKVLGVSFSVAAGMPAGREGPMVQAGAILANVLPTATSTFSRRLGVNLLNDFDRRNFVSMGAAAGVAESAPPPLWMSIEPPLGTITVLPAESAPSVFGPPDSAPP